MKIIAIVSQQTAFLWVLSFHLLIIQPLNSSRKILRVALSLLIPCPWKWSSQREVCPERNNKSSSEVVYVFELSILTSNIPFRITPLSLDLFSFYLKSSFPVSLWKGGLYVLGLMLSMPQGWHANKALHLSVFTWRKILLGKYSSKSPVHQNAYKDIRSFVISPPMPKEMIHSTKLILVWAHRRQDVHSGRRSVICLGRNFWVSFWRLEQAAFLWPYNWVNLQTSS